MMFSELARKYTKEISDDGASGNTIEGYNRYFARFVAYLLMNGRANDVREFTEENLRSFLGWLREQGLGSNTIRNAMSAFSSLAGFALRTPAPKGKGYVLDANPVPRIKRPKHIPPRIDYLTLAELRRMIEVADKAPHNERLAFALVADQPLRASEWVNANVGDLKPHEDGGVAIHVIVKGGRERVKRLGDKVADMLLADLRQREPKPDEPLLVNQEGRRFARQTFSDMINRIARKAGINRQVRAHKIRHTIASAAAHNGASVYEIAEMLNHSSLATAQRYIHGVNPDKALARVREAVWK